MLFSETSFLIEERTEFPQIGESEDVSSPEIPTETFTGIEFGLFPSPEENTKVATSNSCLTLFPDD